MFQTAWTYRKEWKHHEENRTVRRTFDPIHNGHFHIARAFADEIGLDAVVFLPAGGPYHKDAASASAAD
ncbi:hypothetical protein ACRCKR_19495, partial [Acinetobacter baumannii]|uniref:hypothetical protein n=1 Tax=Acinetobacter baumannii TaxID=470 RepID=UPI003D6AD07C